MLMIRPDFILSYWFLFWYFLFILNIVSYNPKFALILGLINNLFHLIEKIIDSVAVEVGMFASNLGYYLLEEGLDISYNSCFRRRPEEWHKVGLDMVDRRPITMISCGYAKKYRQESLSPQQQDADKKPEIDEIVKWM